MRRNMTMFFDDPVWLARWVLLLSIPAIVLSPPVTVLCEILLVALFLSSSLLRQRCIWAIRSQPMVKMGGLFFGVLLLAAWWSAGDWSHRLHALGAWRKMLFFPLAAAVFDDPRWKRRMVFTWIIVAVAGGLVSWLFWLKIGYVEAESVFRNHSVQSMVFSSAIFMAMVVCLHQHTQSSDGMACERPIFMLNKFKLNLSHLLWGVPIILLPNLFIVTTGRGGYAALIIFSVVTCVVFLRGRSLVLGGLLAAMLMSLALGVSPVSRGKIHQAWTEATQYQQSSQLTSMGIRRVFWRNTVGLIAMAPLLGHGTGSFETVYQRYIAGQTGWQAVSTDDPHNQYLKITAEQGVLGLAAMLALIISWFRQPVAMPWRGIGIGIVVVWCATSLGNAHFSTFSEGRLLFLMTGALLTAGSYTARLRVL